LQKISTALSDSTQGNQPDHGFAYLYYFLGKQEKSQAILNTIMSRFYWMGDEGRALCGMDDAGEMSSWYVFNAIGLYPYSPADPDYVVTVPQFNKVTVALTDTTSLTIAKKGLGTKIVGITMDGQKVHGYFVSHGDLLKTRNLQISTRRPLSIRKRTTTLPSRQREYEAATEIFAHFGQNYSGPDGETPGRSMALTCCKEEWARHEFPHEFWRVCVGSQRSITVWKLGGESIRQIDIDSVCKTQCS
jgi:hypothetical protein